MLYKHINRKKINIVTLHASSVSSNVFFLVLYDKSYFSTVDTQKLMKNKWECEMMQIYCLYYKKKKSREQKKNLSDPFQHKNAIKVYEFI